ncbi:hypothetical protein FHS39_002562 [Streptomyces olivoverticillatus]|uniref:Uncharacterized protein n=1 Tax=Streptomyces olivoverticillatus TaxID=66427 RepID=A0A7W7LPV7_9ACTN|nr:hypothetical protein [Streptomyces olivoverticillatus]MBB4893531.1 hypothetical protein [Streptomyces olivoverticillatus]
MPTTPRLVTVDRVIANHGQTVANITQQTVATDLPDFIEQVQRAASILGLGLSSHFQDDADSLSSAATYLADALGLADSDPERAVLLSWANQHLDDLDESDFL